MLCFLHVHRRVLQSVMQLHLITRSRFSGAGPRNSFFLVVANFCYQVQDQVAKLISGSKIGRTFLRNENTLILYNVFPQQSCRGHLRLCS